ncbi:ABC transporter permease [Paenibacillus nasutitermitis]|uniref:Protein lplB n=1 Tax=Paenibacillus nasutitermitis TaxID=1652958 RepID=A0A916ZH77_9BACL|nr:ABC transporter permease subunit [Paenibacillus nasutitermitis]GGD97832.1 protein lplB [Paenibacillus nasutitermitis]
MENTLSRNRAGDRRKLFDRKRLLINIPLFVMFIPIIVYFLVFRYIPMLGLVVAFKDYNFTDGIWGSPWVGLDHFKLLFSNPNMQNILRNTFILSLLQIVVGFPFPILTALLIHEARKLWFKKTVQTAVFLPHFLNWVIVGQIVITIFSQQTGIVNTVVEALFGEPYAFLYHEGSWISIFVGAGIWKGAGWGAIIYLAALAAIDTSLYEAASMDGAGKWRHIWHISLPSLVPVIVIQLILTIGGVMEVGFDQVFVLQNSVVSSISEVISTWSYKSGINGGQFSLATALGLFESLIGLTLVLLTNWVARRYNQGLW